MYRILLLAIAAWWTTADMFPQGFVYKTGFFGFFDNREYFNEYINDQTIFGSRISGELGYALNENSSMMAGLDYLYEFGSKGEWIAPDIIAYYRGGSKNATIYLGAFPRLDKISMPFALMSDTVGYYRSTVEGILLEYRKDQFYHNVWIDWTGRQSSLRREAFLLGFSGYLQKGIFLYQHHFVMTHLAHSLHGGEHIRDNAGFAVLPGMNLTTAVNLDTLSISAGMLASYDRVRGVYEFNFAFGFMGEVNAKYRGLGIKGTVYAGEAQVITSGDGFYKSDRYGRADFFYERAGSGVTGKVQFSMHFIPGVMDLSMQLIIRAHLDGAFKNHQSN